MNKENEQVEIKDEDIQENDFSPEELEDDTTDWKAKAQELKGIAKRRATQLGKAKDKIKSLSEAKPPEQKPPEQKTSQPNEPDYARLAYLEAKGINHPDDQKIIQDEVERLKLPLTDVLQMEHIKSRLQTNKDTREAKEGLPRGGSRTGGYTQHDVEYYLANPDKRPDTQELAEKVLEAKMTQEKNANTFSDQMY